MPRGYSLGFLAARARRFRAREDAVTAVEFAMLAPVFIAATLMLGELGLYEIYAGSLSYATQIAQRQILLGNVANGTQPVNVTNFINNYLCPNLPPPMTCSRLVVNAQVMTPGSPIGFNSWGNLLNASKTWLASVPMDNTKTNFCIGGGGSTVALQVYYAMPFLPIPFLTPPSTTFNGSSVIWIVSTAAFKNEPFSTNYAGC